ncbi:MAG: PaaI family thioesterase [Dehalococcoidales bacterium]|nr:PaaI family thioesterase [Dehalococcoidales bacterium]
MIDNGSGRPRLVAVNRRNPLCVKMFFTLGGGVARADIALNEYHQRADGYIHQGVLACLMDQGMGWISRHGAGVNSITARMDIEYHSPARIDSPLVITVRVARTNRRLLEVEAVIESRDGTLVAKGTCLQFIMGESDKQPLSPE